MMFREASTYFQHFRTVIKKLQRLMKDYEDVTLSVHTLLESRVPRLYTVESDGSVGAEWLDGDVLLGSGIRLDRLMTSSHSLQSRMSEEVISTIQQWFKSYDRCKALLGELSELKFELDSRKRTVLSLNGKKMEAEDKLLKTEQKSKMKVQQSMKGEQSQKKVELKSMKTGGSTREAQLSSTEAKLKHKERKLELCLADFQSKEEELNQAMRALLSEVRILAENIGHVFQILSDAPNDVHRAFNAGMTSSIHPSVHIKPKFNKRESTETESTTVGNDNTNPFLTTA